jgi:hypothetical protein
MTRIRIRPLRSFPATVATVRPRKPAFDLTGLRRRDLHLAA